MSDSKPTKGPTRKFRRRGLPLTCLKCFYPFTVKGASGNCPACGARNLHVDQTKYWNQSPAAVRFEGRAKMGVVIGLIMLTGLILLTATGIGMGQGWVIGFPIVVGWILWDGIGLVTRRTSMLNHRTLWPWLCACIGIAPGLFILTALVITQEYDIGETLLGTFVWAAIWAIPAFGRHVLGNRMARARDLRVQQFRELALSEHAEATESATV